MHDILYDIKFNTAPNGAPTRLKTTLINSTTIIFLWNAPSAEFLHGYRIQVIDNSTGIQMNYTTDSTHLLLNNLYPNHQYTFRVAAHTNERGPFSELTAETPGQQSPTGMLILLLLSSDSQCPPCIIYKARLMMYSTTYIINFLNDLGDIVIAIEEDTHMSYQNQDPLMVTASMLGLVSFILLVVAIVAGIYISYRLCKHDKKVTRYIIY